MITPVTLLTGFLGSGKTTLLARALRDARYADTAVIVNEWGAAPIDHALLRTASGEIAAIAGGCICCSLAGEAVAALRELHFARAAARVPGYRRVVIETSGLAEPAPLAAMLANPAVTAVRHTLAGIVAAVDALHGEARLEAHATARRQAAIADRVVITQCDLASPATVERLHARLAALAPHAEIVRSGEGAEADPSCLFEFDARPAAIPAAGGDGHDPAIASFVWRRAEPASWPGVETALREVAARCGERLLRMKGLVNVAGEPGPRLIHAVGHTLYPSARLARWPDADRSTRLAFIGTGLDEAAVVSILQG